jgi:hypothetical protein
VRPATAKMIEINFILNSEAVQLIVICLRDCSNVAKLENLVSGTSLQGLLLPLYTNQRGLRTHASYFSDVYRLGWVTNLPCF